MGLQMSYEEFTTKAVEIIDLGKCYYVYKQPIDRLKQAIVRNKKKYFKEFWALHDINFSLKHGETVGIIGLNGSGKSTLLQIICGTLTQTSGRVKSNGKVAALLELGAGFNPEFTGIENVQLSASLYGLTETQIKERMDAIITFADIGEHIFQPVKHYSSGMYVRLAFAVIAHVDADILVIDEALAVGDAAFTQKCMRFIRKFREHGTLLFVSHDMSSVLNLCDRAIWLDGGTVREMGPAKIVSQNYLKFTLQDAYGDGSKLEALNPVYSNTNKESKAEKISDYTTNSSFVDNLNASNGWKTGHGEIISVNLACASNPGELVFKGGELITLTITAKANEFIARPILGFLVRDKLGQDLFGENSLNFTFLKPLSVSNGQMVSCTFDFILPMLPNGQYSVAASFADGDLVNNIQHHWLHEALILNVSSSNVRWGLVGVKFKNIDMRILNEGL